MGRVILSIFLCLSLSQPLAAQRIQDNKKAEATPGKPRAAASIRESEKLTVAKQRALAVLDEMLVRTDAFEDPLIRIRARIDIADALWRFDEPRARAILTESFAAIARLRVTNSDSPAFAQTDPSYWLRSELTSMAASHDGALAQSLIATFESEQARLLGGLASTLAGREPGRAATIASELIEKGNLQEALQVLPSLRDRTRAHDLVVQAIEVCKRDPEVARRSISELAGYFFPSFGEGVIRFSRYSFAPPDPTPRELQLAPQFLELAHQVLMDQLGSQPSPQTSASLDLLIARLLLPYFKQYLPKHVPTLQQRVEESLKASVGSGDDPLFSSVAYYSLTVNEMLGRAAMINDVQKRDQAYELAFSRALNTVQFAEAGQILRLVSNDGHRASLRSQLEEAVKQEQRLKGQRAMIRGGFDEAYKLFHGLTDQRARALNLAYLANAMSGKDQKARAAGLIEEARSAAAGLATAVDRAFVLVVVTDAALRIDPTTNIGATISAVNAAGFASRWDQIGGVSVHLPPMFTLLGKQDFEKSIELAHEIRIQELSVFAQIGACRAVLDPNYPQPTWIGARNCSSGEMLAV
jgi:hypothetical protein